MRSARHKVLHQLAGRPLIDRVLDLVTGAGASHVVGRGRPSGGPGAASAAGGHRHRRPGAAARHGPRRPGGGRAASRLGRRAVAGPVRRRCRWFAPPACTDCSRVGVDDRAPLALLTARVSQPARLWARPARRRRQRDAHGRGAGRHARAARGRRDLGRLHAGVDAPGCGRCSADCRAARKASTTCPSWSTSRPRQGCRVEAVLTAGRGGGARRQRSGAARGGECDPAPPNA